MLGPGGLDVRGAAEAVLRGSWTEAALVADARARIAAAEPDLGAVVTAVDLAGAPGGPLAGVVAAVKDSFALDAAVVARLVAAGASIVATTRLDPLAWGVSTPGTRNPVAADRIAGGSSGGSAAMVAAGLVHAALGSDSGGSVRIPAACCGIAGFKPTFGRLPTAGLQPTSPSFDTVGVLAADTAGCATVLRALDPTVEAVPERRVRRVGIPDEVARFPLDPVVRAVWEHAQQRLLDAGIRVSPVALPELDGAAQAHGRLFVLEGLAVHAEAFAAAPARYPAWFPDLARRRAEIAAKAPAALAHARDLRAALRRVLGTVDVLLVPTMAVPTPPAGATATDVGGETRPLEIALTHLTAPFNLAGLPAGSVPAGHDAAGAPIGLQLVGPADADALVLAAMSLVERLAA